MGLSALSRVSAGFGFLPGLAEGYGVLVARSVESDRRYSWLSFRWFVDDKCEPAQWLGVVREPVHDSSKHSVISNCA